MLIFLITQFSWLDATHLAIYQDEGTALTEENMIDILFASEKVHEKTAVLPQKQVNVLPKQIAFNCVPLVGDIRESGYTREEEKIIEETQKILSEPELNVVPTAVRVPTRVSHAMSVNAELAAPLDLDRATGLWQNASGVAYSVETLTPIDAEGADTVTVSRLRRDPTRPHAITYWVVGDNLRKGAATNSVQIAELF